MAETNKPLAGKRIVITRAPEQAAELTGLLENMGAEVVTLPAVAFAPPEDWGALDNALRQLEDFDAILFLSRNAVRYVFGRCRDLGIKCEALGSSNRIIAAVGPGTAQQAAQEGLQVTYVAKNRTGESLVRELHDSLVGRSVLLPRSDRGDARVPSALREAGAKVTEVIAYRTIMPEPFDPAILERIRRAEVDAMVFASPSAFKNFAGSLGSVAANELSGRVHFAAIGPTTARSMRNAGAHVDIEVADAGSIGATGIAGAVAHYFQQRPAAAPVRPA